VPIVQNGGTFHVHLSYWPGTCHIYASR